jgi:hypothetical protein
VFDVFAEGTRIVDDLDLVVAAGPKTAYTRSAKVTITDGRLDVRFVASVENAIISSLALLPA